MNDRKKSEKKLVDFSALSKKGQKEYVRYSKKLVSIKVKSHYLVILKFFFSLLFFLSLSVLLFPFEIRNEKKRKQNRYR